MNNVLIQEVEEKKEKAEKLLPSIIKTLQNMNVEFNYRIKEEKRIEEKILLWEKKTNAICSPNQLQRPCTRCISFYKRSNLIFDYKEEVPFEIQITDRTNLYKRNKFHNEYEQKNKIIEIFAIIVVKEGNLEWNI